MSQLPRLAPRLVSRCLQTSSRSLAPEDNRSGPSSFNRGTAGVSTPPSPNNAVNGLSRGGASQLTRSTLYGREPGKYYSPSFLNLEEQNKDRRVLRRYPTLGPSKSVAKEIDPLFKAGLHPGHPSLHDDSYKNPLLLSDYVSEMGKIQPRKTTQLTRRSQREVGKAIRRARSMGLIPVMSKDQNVWKRNR